MIQISEFTSMEHLHTAIHKSSEKASGDIIMLVMKLIIVITQSPHKRVRQLCHPIL